MHGITLQSQSPGAAGADLGFRLATLVNGAPMAMREQELSLMLEAIAANRFTLPRNRKTAARITERGTAIVEIHGVLLNRAPILGNFWGMSFYEGLAEQCRRLATDTEVKRIVLDIDSPGGLVAGIKGAAAAIEELADKKPVYALAHDMACSAGYWLACVAQELSVTADGEVGSIGVRAGHVSYAEALDRDGVVVTMMRAGATKTDLNPYGLLDDGAAAEAQFAIERDYDRFCAHVARHRDMSVDAVRATDARTFVGDKAVEAGLADRIETLEELIERVEKGADKVRAKRKKPTEPGSRAGMRPSERRPVVPDEDEPAAGPINTRGAKLMSERNMAAESTFSAADIAAAVLAVRDAKPAASAPVQDQRQASQPAEQSADKVAAAVEAERTRIFGILESAEGKARPAMAVKLAKRGLAADVAVEIMAETPAEKAEATAEDGQQKALGNALERAMSRPGNSAGIKPEGEGAGKKKSFADLCGETARTSKKG